MELRIKRERFEPRGEFPEQVNSDESNPTPCCSFSSDTSRRFVPTLGSRDPKNMGCLESGRRDDGSYL
jgi:hypothetical protein